MSTQEDIQKLAPGAIVELYELDTTAIGGADIDRFHVGVNGLGNDIVWQGNTYTRFPIEASGFEYTGGGTSPQPRVRVSNIGGIIGALATSMDDLINAKLTRKRVFSKYLDAVNFEGGVNPTADPNAGLAEEIYYISRKANENKVYIEFELAAAGDLAGVMIPQRQVIANVCTWQYRSAECSYAGDAVADANDVATTVLANDKCGKRLSSCKLRFGENGTLPYGGFPGVGRI